MRTLVLFLIVIAGFSCVHHADSKAAEVKEPQSKEEEEIDYREIAKKSAENPEVLDNYGLSKEEILNKLFEKPCDVFNQKALTFLIKDEEYMRLLREKHIEDIKESFSCNDTYYHITLLAGYVHNNNLLPSINKHCSTYLGRDNEVDLTYETDLLAKEILTCEMVLAKYGEEELLEKIYKRSNSEKGNEQFVSMFQLAYVGGDDNLRYIISSRCETLNLVSPGGQERV